MWIHRKDTNLVLFPGPRGELDSTSGYRDVSALLPGGDTVKHGSKYTINTTNSGSLKEFVGEKQPAPGHTPFFMSPTPSQGH